MKNNTITFILLALLCGGVAGYYYAKKTENEK